MRNTDLSRRKRMRRLMNMDLRRRNRKRRMDLRIRDIQTDLGVHTIDRETRRTFRRRIGTEKI